MSQCIQNENILDTCPYDNAHRVKKSRFQLHIAKCKLNHLDAAKVPCAFNATHLVPQAELQFHYNNCPDRAPLDRQLAQGIDKNNPFKGRTDVPPVSDPIPVKDEEVWDVDTHIVQLPPPPPGAVLEPGEFQRPAERKKFYEDLHRAPRAEGATSIPPPAPAPLKPPRQPIKHSSIAESNKPSAHVIENLGLGRGKPPSRIAANFQKVEVAPNTYSQVLSDMGNLGLGRGKASKTTKTPYISYDDDDFPALGCGRGRMHKQNVRPPGARPKN